MHFDIFSELGVIVKDTAFSPVPVALLSLQPLLNYAKILQ